MITKIRRSQFFNSRKTALQKRRQNARSGKLAVETLEDRKVLALLGLGGTLQFPVLTYDSGGLVAYDAAAESFDVDATPLAFRLTGTSPPRPVVGTVTNPRDFQIHIEVDNTGALIGGVAGVDDLKITGEIDTDNNGIIDAAGVLLTGEILAFGFENNGVLSTGADKFEFRFTPTGGALFSYFAGQDIGVTLDSEFSTMPTAVDQSFVSDFSGGAKGLVGPIPILDTPAPGIDIVKLTNDTDNNSPTGPVVPVGSPVTFTYIVTNTGGVPLANVVVVDDNGTLDDTSDDFSPIFTGGDTNNNGLLDLDETWEYSATHIAVAGQYENWATVTGTGNDTPVEDEDVDHHFGADPGIEIIKYTNGHDANDPTGADSPGIAPGGVVTWTYLVTNTGNIPFDASEISIVDDNGTPGDTSDDFGTAAPSSMITFLNEQSGNGDNILDPGEAWLYIATGTALDLNTPGASSTFNFSGGSSTDGTDGNVRTFTAGSLSVNVSAWGRNKANGAWSEAWLGAYSGGLGVTDEIEGSGGSNMHTVDNVGYDNYVLFEFSSDVIVDAAFLGYVVDDSDLTVWIGSAADPFNNHLDLNDAVLASLGFTEVNLTNSSSARWADLNAGNVKGNVLVIAAHTEDDSPEDRFKIEKVTVREPQAGIYGNVAVVNVPGASDDDPSHYTNIEAEPAVEIIKYTNGLDANDPTGADAPSIAPGGVVTWTYLVTNTGNVSFAAGEVSIVDDNGTPDDTSDDFGTAAPSPKITFLNEQSGNGDNILEPGESWMYIATGTAQNLGTPGASSTFHFTGNSYTDGGNGNVRTYTAGSVSVNVSAWARNKTNDVWSTAWLGAYSGGLGVTDNSEGSGGSNMHTVDNVGYDNYVLFEFSSAVIVDAAYLGYVVNDSDLTVWIGTKADPFNNHLTLNGAVLSSLGFTEVNNTSSSSARWADLNAGNVSGNVLVIAAKTNESSPNDRFKIEKVKVRLPQAGLYGNMAEVFVPGDSDSDISHYKNVTTGSIGGTKYRDVSGNGLNLTDSAYSPADVPLAGTTVYLDLDKDGVKDWNEPSQVTDANGNYLFSDLAPGVYQVREIVPSGWLRTAPTTSDKYVVTVQAGGASTGNDFANFEKVCDDCLLSDVYYVINGIETVNDLRGNTSEGDVITVHFTIRSGSEPQVFSLVSYLAPGSTFVAEDADEQVIFDVDRGVFGPGKHTLTVTNPSSYFQVDFVCGEVIDQFGPAGGNIFYTPQGRLISADNGGTRAQVDSPSSIRGFVYTDKDNDGKLDYGERAITGVKVRLTGTNKLGQWVSLTDYTDANGMYQFGNLLPGKYTITETQPLGFNQGKANLPGTIDGVRVGSASGSDKFVDIILSHGVEALNYNFAELLDADAKVHSGQSATIGFWQGEDGQDLILSLNGGASSKSLATWLSTNFPNMYGSSAGSKNLVGKTNVEVAALFRNLYKVSGQKLDAQALAVALAVYVTDCDLAGDAAVRFGFQVTTSGLGAATYNVGSNGAAFGVSNYSVLTVWDILVRTNNRARKGVLWDSDGNGWLSSSEQSLRTLAHTVLMGINEDGDIE